MTTVTAPPAPRLHVVPDLEIPAGVMARWLVRLVDACLRALICDHPPPIVPTARTSTAPIADPLPRLRQPKPVHRALHVLLPVMPLPGGVTWGERPWCWCGKTWTDTPQGWAARDRHNDKGLPECGEAFRRRKRDRERQTRQAVKADRFWPSSNAYMTAQAEV